MTLGLALVFAPACEGDEGDESVGEGETETGAADEVGGDIGVEGDAGDGDEGDADDSGEGDGDGDGDSGDGDGDELTGCAAIADADTCINTAGCGPVYGVAVIDDGEGAWCTLAEEQFIGCASSGELCPMLGKTLCDGSSVWQTTGCVPGNLVICEPPGGISGPC